MGYVVTIKRDPPITREDLRELLKSDETLLPLTDRSAETDGLRWRGGGVDVELPLPLDQGSIWSTPRTDAGLLKMQELARKLGARLVGEEGEDLSGINVLPAVGRGCGANAAILMVWILVAAAIAVAA